MLRLAWQSLLLLLLEGAKGLTFSGPEKERGAKVEVFEAKGGEEGEEALDQSFVYWWRC